MTEIIKTYMAMPEYVQIFLFMCTLVGAYIVWRFRAVFALVAFCVGWIFVVIKKDRL